jgi:hypothetical protein
MTADEERRIRELPSLIAKESDASVVQKLAAELNELLTRSVEAKKKKPAQ